MSNRSETFGRLLKGAINSIATYEGKTAPIIEEELGAKIGLASTSIQRYKAGHLPPDPRTVEIIAEAAVQRGYLYREWLQRFLHAARYHQTDQLLDRLCPIGPAHPRSPRVYQNLPAPTYSQFVMREAAFAEVLDGLSKRSAAVVIVGLGGNGKTSLAREVADCCLKGDGSAALFDAAVWVSDKDRPGTTNLSLMLDEIARTLDYPGFTQFEHDEKRHEIEQLLRRQRVLVCIDNFETITDGVLLAWLLNLPEPSKALITTREYRREFRRGGWPVELRGMSDSEVRALVDERLKVLRLNKLVNDPSYLESMIAATGGNPKAIEMTLGLMKYERRSLQEVVDDLYAARGDLFDDLFTRAWSLLDETGRRVLLVATCFPTSVSSGSLSAAADLQGFAFERAVERLCDLALLDVQQIDLNSVPLYVLHPLVQAFAGAKMARQPELETGAHERWISYLIRLLELVPPDRHVEKIEIMDQHSATIQSFLEWAHERQQQQQYLRLFLATHILLNSVPLHHERIDYTRWCADAAQSLGEYEVQIRALLQIARLYMYYRERKMAHPAYEQAKNLAKSVQLDPEARRRTDERLGTTHVLLLIYTDQVAAANDLIAELLPNAQRPDHALALRYYSALCLHKLRRDEDAQPILVNILAQQDNAVDLMTLCRACTTLVEITLAAGDAAVAGPVVDRNLTAAMQIRDRYQIARARKNQGHLFLLRGELTAAHASLTEAINLFERLGMRREHAETCEMLRHVELGEVSTP
jgi:hypothetical protein